MLTMFLNLSYNLGVPSWRFNKFHSVQSAGHKPWNGCVSWLNRAVRYSINCCGNRQYVVLFTSEFTVTCWGVLSTFLCQVCCNFFLHDLMLKSQVVSSRQWPPKETIRATLIALPGVDLYVVSLNALLLLSGRLWLCDIIVWFDLICLWILL